MSLLAFNFSFRMANRYLDHVGDVDVISDAEVQFPIFPFNFDQECLLSCFNKLWFLRMIQ